MIPTPAFGAEPPARPLPRWLALVALLALVVCGAAIRIQYTYAIPMFDPESSAGYLQTDSAFLAYLTDRVVDAGGGIPGDFGADTRIEHPDPSDVFAMFTVGQEFVIAWAKLLAGSSVSLHVVAVWIMSLFAALTVIGVWGVGRELTGSRAWGLGAALVWFALLASYRTLGFIFIREDFSMPIYALHLWLVLRACRVRTPTSYLAAGATAALAAATWHAMGQFLAIEVACLALWFLRSGQNPFSLPRVWLATAAMIALSLLIPVLRAKGFALSAPAMVVIALTVAGLAARKAPGRGPGLLAFAVALVLLGGGSFALSSITGSGMSDYAHVFELLWAKISNLGVLPADPNELTPDTRVLWQGPFATASADDFTRRLGLVLLPAAVAVALSARAWITGRGDGRVAVFVAVLLASCAVAWLIKRTNVVTSVLSAACAAAVLARLRPRVAAVALLLVIAGWQGWVLQRGVLSRPTAWWTQPQPGHVAQRADLVGWVSANVPEDEAIASDFVTGSNLLYHTRRPSLLQPKYETVRSRQRIEEFFEIFYHGEPDDLRRWMEAHDCQWFALNIWWMWHNRYIGGLPMSATRPADGTPAAWFMSRQAKIFTRVPGFELRYQSPDRFRLANFRVYRLP